MEYQQRDGSSTHAPHRHFWTVEEYHQLIKTRVVGVNQPTELLAGQIIRRSLLQNKDHVASIQCLHRMLQWRLGDRARTDPSVVALSQQPVILGRYSELVPDIAVVVGEASRYANHHPNPVEIQLILEVTEGPLLMDGWLKAIEYAEAGIQDYWVLDLNRVQLHVFRELGYGHYRQRLVLNQGDTITPLAFPDLQFRLREPLPLYYLTRKFKGHSHHPIPLSPLVITPVTPLVPPSAQPVTVILKPQAPTPERLPQSLTIPVKEAPTPVGVGVRWPVMSPVSQQ
jgi:Uma2 family endonuclease